MTGRMTEVLISCVSSWCSFRVCHGRITASLCDGTLCSFKSKTFSGHRATPMAVSKPIIAVVHATSKQGTSVVNSLLQTGRYAVKALTRDANSDSALQYQTR